MPSENTWDRTGVLDGVASSLSSSQGSTGQLDEAGAARPGTPIPSNRRMLERLGPYRLLRKLGQGGMGTVYLGEDERTGASVAVKVLAREAVPDEQAICRFRKEARLLSEVRHPHVANLIEAGEEEGTCFLVMEFVAGTDLRGLLGRQGRLSEKTALQIVRDVAEALAEAHGRGIVHRDIKPANILMSAAPVGDESPADAVLAAVAGGCKPLVKLSDFGLARHVDQSASLDLTRTGAMLGTPHFIAPEQCTDRGEVCPATDIYSLGATLFEMLAGRPPFTADDPVKLISMHCFEEAPDLRKLESSVSDGTARLVAKMLEKSPQGRFADAAHLLLDVDRLLRGETNDVDGHPCVPVTTGPVIEAIWEWDLDSPPERLWPLVSNTERINCAVGVPSVEYATERDAHGALRKFGTFRLGWAEMNWEEHPFEWVEGQRLGVLREFRKGPFDWFLSVVELTARAGEDGQAGTRLKHTVRIAPRGWLGKLLAHLEVDIKGRRALDRIYNRIDRVTSGRLAGSPALDAFVPPASLRSAILRRLEARREQLPQIGLDVLCVERLLEFVRESPPQELARIRPHALARRTGVAADAMTEVCLHACHAGLLELHWDILCPTCRTSSTVRDTLAEIDRHARCEACDLDFDVDFGNAVELIFRVHPDVRQADLRTYCIGGPEHAPHVVAQARLGAGESLQLDLTLDSGAYVLRGPQLPYAVGLIVERSGAGRAWLPLSKDFDPARLPVLRSGRQVLTLENKYERPLLLRIERTVPRTDVLTAAEASRLVLFGELFPKEVLSRDRLSDYSACTLLAIRATNTARLCDEWGEAAAYLGIAERFRRLRQTIEVRGGQVVKLQDEQLLAAFPETGKALRAAVELLRDPVPAVDEPEVLLRGALHRGTALSTTINGRLDYFGRTVKNTVGLLEAGEGPLVLSSELGRDEEVLAYLEREGLDLQDRASHESSSCGSVFEVMLPQTTHAQRV